MKTRKQIEDNTLNGLAEGTKQHIKGIPDCVPVFVRGYMPRSLLNKFIQHIRDFDTAHPDCHFEMNMDVPDMTNAEIIDMVRVNPELTFTQIFKRGIHE